MDNTARNPYSHIFEKSWIARGITENVDLISTQLSIEPVKLSGQFSCIWSKYHSHEDLLLSNIKQYSIISETKEEFKQVAEIPGDSNEVQGDIVKPEENHVKVGFNMASRVPGKILYFPLAVSLLPISNHTSVTFTIKSRLYYPNLFQNENEGANFRLTKNGQYVVSTAPNAKKYRFVGEHGDDICSFGVGFASKRGKFSEQCKFGLGSGGNSFGVNCPVARYEVQSGEIVPHKSGVFCSCIGTDRMVFSNTVKDDSGTTFEPLSNAITIQSGDLLDISIDWVSKTSLLSISEWKYSNSNTNNVESPLCCRCRHVKYWKSVNLADFLDEQPSEFRDTLSEETVFDLVFPKHLSPVVACSIPLGYDCFIVVPGDEDQHVTVHPSGFVDDRKPSPVKPEYLYVDATDEWHSFSVYEKIRRLQDWKKEEYLTAVETFSTGLQHSFVNTEISYDIVNKFEGVRSMLPKAITLNWGMFEVWKRAIIGIVPIDSFPVGVFVVNSIQNPTQFSYNGKKSVIIDKNSSTFPTLEIFAVRVLDKYVPRKKLKYDHVRKSTIACSDAAFALYTETFNMPKENASYFDRIKSDNIDKVKYFNRSNVSYDFESIDSGESRSFSVSSLKGHASFIARQAKRADSKIEGPQMRQSGIKPDLMLSLDHVDKILPVSGTLNPDFISRDFVFASTCSKTSTARLHYISYVPFNDIHIEDETDFAVEDSISRNMFKLFSKRVKLLYGLKSEVKLKKSKQKYVETMVTFDSDGCKWIAEIKTAGPGHGEPYFASIAAGSAGGAAGLLSPKRFEKDTYFSRTLHCDYLTKLSQNRGKYQWKKGVRFFQQPSLATSKKRQAIVGKTFIYPPKDAIIAAKGPLEGLNQYLVRLPGAILAGSKLYREEISETGDFSMSVVSGRYDLITEPLSKVGLMFTSDNESTKVVADFNTDSDDDNDDAADSTPGSRIGGLMSTRNRKVPLASPTILNTNFSSAIDHKIGSLTRFLQLRDDFDDDEALNAASAANRKSKMKKKRSTEVEDTRDKDLPDALDEEDEDDLFSSDTPLPEKVNFNEHVVHGIPGHRALRCRLWIFEDESIHNAPAGNGDPDVRNFSCFAACEEDLDVLEEMEFLCVEDAGSSQI